MHNCLLYRLSWVEVNGTLYKHGMVAVLDVDLIPVFGVICDILVFNTDVYHFVCEILFTECFSHHFHSYQTRKQVPVKYVCCKQSDLYDPTTLSSYSILSQPDILYIPLKYQLIDNQ